MVLSLRGRALTCLVLLGVISTVVSAQDEVVDKAHLTLAGVETYEVSGDEVDLETLDPMYKTFQLDNAPLSGSQAPVLDSTGKVISLARDLVALGEDIYKLVVKGKPSNTLKYAPISVIPRDQKNEPVDIMTTENWKFPVRRTFEVVYKNLYRVKVVKFRYSVIYSYGGTYEGKGAYLTAVQIIPESVSTVWGYDFTATMKLGGIQNNGTRENPVAGALLLMEYSVNTILKASTEVRTVFVTGKGEFKRY